MSAAAQKSNEELSPQMPLNYTIVYEDGQTLPGLTIDDVIESIPFPPESGMYKSLSYLAKRWYEAAMKENCTEEEAALVALEKMEWKLNEIDAWAR